MRYLLVTVHLFVFALVFGFPGVSNADDWKWIWEQGEKKWLPQFEMTARPGNDDLYGLQLDPFIPIVQNDVSLYFLNVKGNLFWNRGDLSEEINVGGGYRRLMGDGGWILGGYGFYDRLESQYDNEFNQGTLGIEALAWNWEARANGYIAEDDEEFAGEAGGTTASLVGNVLMMDSGVEKAMSGLDAEVGWRLPFFGDDGALSDTRLYAGGFYFDADGVDPITGPMTRFETRLWEVPFLPVESRVTLGTEYRWDDVRKHDVTGLIAVRIPLGAPARSEPLTNVERRMTDRVVRDVSVVTSTNSSYTENVRTRTGVVVGETYFFDAETDGDGSFEYPATIWNATDTTENSLVIGLNRTGDIDLGGLTVYLNHGHTVMGGGTQIPVWGVDSGQMAMFTAPGAGPATLCCTGTGFELAFNNTIAGLGFRNMGTALHLDLDADSTMADIYNNRFWDLGEFTGVDVDVTFNSALTLYLTENWFRNAGTGLDLSTNSDSFHVALDVRGNHFEDMETGLNIDLFPDGSNGPSTFALTAVQNTFIDLTSSGIETYVNVTGDEDYTHTTNLSENVFIDNGNDDYELSILGGTSDAAEVLVDVAMANNSSVGGGPHFADIDVDPIPEGHIGIEIVDNVIADIDDNAIDVFVDEGPDVEALIFRNEITGGDEDGIHLTILNSGNSNGHVLTITENTIADVGGHGIAVRVEDSDDTTLTIADNSVTGAGDDSGTDRGIEVDLLRVGDDVGNTIAIRRNTLQLIDDDGINVEVNEGYDTALTIADNSIANAGSDEDDGIEVVFTNVGLVPGTNEIYLGQNTLEFIDGDGIDVDVNDGTNTELQIASNLVRYIDEEGIDVDFDDVGFADGGRNTILINERNTLEFIDKDGIEVDVTNDSNDTRVDILDNFLAFIGEDGSDDEGIQVRLDSVGHDEGNSIRVHENTIANVVGGADGIKVDVDYGYDTDLLIADNELSNIDDDGIDVEFYEVGHNLGNTITIDGRNTIDRAGDDGIDVELNDLVGESEETTLTIGDNTVTDSGENGIEIELDQANDAEVTVENNTVARSGEDGIEVEMNDETDDNVVTIAGNDVSSSGEDGIDVEINNTADDNVVTIAGNQVANSGEKGIEVEIYEGWDNEVTIESNQVSMSGEHGIEIDIEGVLEIGSDRNEFVVRANEISTSGENGIDVWIDDGDNDANVLQIGGNTISSVEDGIQIDSESTGDATILSDADGNNSVSSFSDEAADIDGGPYDGTLRVNGVDVPGP